MKLRWRTDLYWKRMEPVGFKSDGVPIWPSYERRWRYRSRRSPKPNARIWYGVAFPEVGEMRPELPRPAGAQVGNRSKWVEYRALPFA